MSEVISDLVDTLLSNDPATNRARFHALLDTQSDEEIALALESLPPESRLESWRDIPEDRQIAILIEMRVDPRRSILRQIGITDAAKLLENCDAETLIELSDSLPENLIDHALNSMDEKQQKLFAEAAKYEDSQLGHWVNHDILVVSQNLATKDALRVLRRGIPKFTEYIYLIDRMGYWKGCVRIADITLAQGHEPISSLMSENVNALNANADVWAASDNLARSDQSAIPVINDDGLLLGRLDIATAIAFIRERAEGQLMAQAGMDEEEDLFGGIRRTAGNRSIWLGINLLTALLAAWFIGLFEATLQEVVALAVLMPVVASMGGIAGSQTLTLIIRGLALGQITKANFAVLMSKEVRVSLLTGLTWSIIIGGVTILWFGSVAIGAIIAIAIIVNIITSAIFGVLTPVLLDHFKLDPALSGSVILTTATDVVGFVTFLGLGTLVFM